MSRQTPSRAMMVPVNAVVRFMRTLDSAHVDGAFVIRELVIVENFAPYVFAGPRAMQRWSTGFAEHARHLSGLRATFGPARDYGSDADRAFFTLPTTWTGKSEGRPFDETGAWSFVLKKRRAAWRILAYAWGVTSIRYVQ